MKILGMQIVGSAYRNGTRMPGWGIVRTENGRDLYFSEDENGFDFMLRKAQELGYDVKSFILECKLWYPTLPEWVR